MDSDTRNNSPAYLSRTFDHLNTMATLLEGMQGYDTLIRELLQNADDVEGATFVTFKVTRDALIVENDAEFRSCGELDKKECPWRRGERKHRCDFHRLLHIAGADKKRELETTGAFGIGFISSYLVSDRPEIISAGQHWRLEEENQRVQLLPFALEPNQPKTRFVFPWAKDSESVIRKELRVSAVEPDVQVRFMEALRATLPSAMLFLRRIIHASLRDEDKEILSFQRVESGGEVVVSEAFQKSQWKYLLLRHDFSEVGARLIKCFPDQIGTTRRADVTIAIGNQLPSIGLLYACLPTRQLTGISVHINARFFPSSNRKDILFDSSPRAEWNRAALASAAGVLARNIELVRDRWGMGVLWELISSSRRLLNDVNAKKSDAVFGKFWEEMSRFLKSHPIVFTTASNWALPKDVRLPRKDIERAAIELLSKLGIQLPHADLWTHRNILLELGARDVAAEDLVHACAAAKVDKPINMDALPEALKGSNNLNLARAEMAVLLGTDDQKRRANAAGLAKIALAPVGDALLAPIGSAYRTDHVARLLFRAIDSTLHFLDENRPELPTLWSQCPKFDLGVAIDVLERAGSARIEELWKSGQLDLVLLYQYLEDKLSKASGSAFAGRLAELPLYPVGKGLRNISSAALPGNFEDPIGLTSVFDVGAIGPGRTLLEKLGARPLTLEEYVTNRLPDAIESGRLDRAVLRRVIDQLSSHLSELRKSNAARASLSPLSMFECGDGQLRNAGSIYIDVATVRECLEDTVPYLAANSGDFSVVQFTEWLGAANVPKPENLVQRIKALVSDKPSDETLQAVSKVYSYLSTLDESGLGAYAVLRNLRWLPAEGHPEEWFLPRELHWHTHRELFHSQGKFLAFKAPAANLREFVGIQIKPTTQQVVAHLLHCVAHDVRVDNAVYLYLSQECSEHSEVLMLRDSECLWVNDKYVSPAHAYWKSNPFGRYRHRLGDSYLKFAALLNRIGVRAAPNAEDAVTVLREIGLNTARSSIGDEDTELDVVATCWRMIDDALEDGRLESSQLNELKAIRCIPTKNEVLQAPCLLLFEDRADMVAKFEGHLQGTLIARPLKGGNAMQAAGVQNLSAVVAPEIIKAEPMVSSPLVTERINQRMLLIQRAIAASLGPEMVEAATSAIQRIRFEAVSQLVVRFHVNHESFHQQSREFDVQAVSIPDEHRLLFAQHSADLPWTDVSRELSNYISGGGNVTTLTLYFDVVLGAISPDAANKKLDSCGAQRFDFQFGSTGVSQSSVTDLDDQNSEVRTEANTKARGIPAARVSAEHAPMSTGSASADPAQQGQRPLTEPHAEGRAITRSKAPASRGDMSEEGIKEMSQVNGSPCPDPTVQGTTPGRRTRRRPPVPKSFISVELNESAAGEASESSIQAQMLGDAGEVLALEWEKRRAPENSVRRMARNNEGFDILSEGPGGRRRIEVKALSGNWDGSVVEVSGAQFRHATDPMEAPSEWWLYVIENARDHKRHVVTPIHNPFYVATRYRFDEGWRNAASLEASVATEAEPILGATYETNGHELLTVLDTKQKGRLWHVVWKDSDGHRGQGIWSPTWSRKKTHGKDDSGA